MIEKTKNKRIAIDVRSVSQIGGVKTHIDNTIPRIIAERPDWHFYLFATSKKGTEIFADFKNTSVIKIGLPKALLLIYDWLLVPITCSFLRVSLFHGTKSAISPLYHILKIRTVTTLHDIIPLKHPETADLGSAIYWRIQIPTSYKYADHIITDSNFSKTEMIDYFGPRENVFPIHLGTTTDKGDGQENTKGWQNLCRKYLITQPYILSVGTLQPRKNYITLIKAFEQIRLPDIKLIIVGRRGWKDNPIFEYIRSHELSDRVLILNEITNEELTVLYDHSSLFAFLSLYEGFGLPIIEAMERGIPVIASNASCLPEIGGKACHFVDPADANQVAQSIELILKNKIKRKNLVAEGKKNIKRFSWDTCANETLAIYTRIFDQMDSSPSSTQ